MDPELIVSEIQALRTQMDVMQQTLNWIVTSQRTESEMVRKSANSISVIIRLLAVKLRLNMDGLSNFLVESEALLETVKSPSNLDVNRIESKDYSKTQIKLMLMDLIKAVEASEQHNADINKSTVNPTNEQSTNSQTKISHVTPDIPSTVKTQYKNSGDVKPMTKNNNYLINSGMVPMYNNNDNDNDTNLMDTNKKKREEEDKNRLRRKYNNKYRYLNMTKKVLSTQNVNNAIDNVQNNNKLPNDENNVRIYVVSNDNGNVPDCKVVLRPIRPLQQRVLTKKFDNHSMEPEIRNNLRRRISQTRRLKAQNFKKRKGTEVETVTKEQTLTKNKRFIQFEKGESSKTLPNNK